MEYFIIDHNGQQAGPFSMDQLTQKAITPETLVWAQGMADWTPAWKVAELKNVLEAAEAIRTNATQAQPQNQDSEVPPSYQGQDNFQQAQQAAYQQGFQHGASMNGSQPSKKKSSKNLWKVILGLIVFILLVFAFTNPNADAHKEKVRTEVGKVIDQATSSTDNNFFSQSLRSIAKMMADNIMDEAMSHLFEYHNYVLFSKGTVSLNGKEHTVSFGILGKVYTMNADDMVKALEGNNVESTIEYSSDGNADEEGAQAEDEGDLGSRVQKKLEDKANEAMDKAADKVQKKLEEKINQELDAATDSSKIEKVIDKILELL